MLEDFKTSVKKILSERLVSPFLGTFTLSYVILNWKLLLIFLSTDFNTNEKISSISVYLKGEHKLIDALIFTIIFIVVYPWVATGTFYLWELAKKVKRNMFYKLENSTVLPIERAVALREEYNKANERFLDLFKDKKEIEEKYKEDLSKAQSTIASLESKLSEITKELRLYSSDKDIAEVVSDEESKVLLLVNKSGDEGQTKKSISESTKIEYNRLLYVLQKIEEKQLIFSSGGTYYLTPIGRKLVYEKLINRARRIELPEKTNTTP